MRAWGVGLVLVVCLVALSAMPSGAASDLAASIKAQLKTATFHAGELAQKGAIAATQLHLHHTINCLEGESGPDFFAASGNVCKGQGHGILPDLKTAIAAGVPGARAALDNANIALMLAKQAQGMTDVSEAQPWAFVVAEYLKKASDDLGAM